MGETCIMLLFAYVMRLAAKMATVLGLTYIASMLSDIESMCPLTSS